MLNHRKAVVAPMMTAQSAARIKSPLMYARIPNAPNAIIRSPPARPSRPSVKFTEFDVARKMNMNRGMYHHPRVTSPNPGMLIESNPSFSKNQYAPTPPNIVSHSILNFALSPFCLPTPLILR